MIEMHEFSRCIKYFELSVRANQIASTSINFRRVYTASNFASVKTILR
jgi:hypothetical protein